MRMHPHSDGIGNLFDVIHWPIPHLHSTWECHSNVPWPHPSHVIMPHSFNFASRNACRSLRSACTLSFSIQDGHLTTWSPIVASTLPLSTISLGLVIFDYHQKGKLFDYGFTRHSNNQIETLQPRACKSMLWFLAHMGKQHLTQQWCFLFPFVACPKRTWPLPQSCTSFRQRLLSSCTIWMTLRVQKSWDTFMMSAKFFLLNELQESNERHSSMYKIVESRISPCYVYVHEDKISQDTTKDLAMHT